MKGRGARRPALLFKKQEQRNVRKDMTSKD